eukprot:CAMPEP_0197003296 /NCGR_PEP_ID=MMETSP1380-20130617/7604_1 /TAXON_ID=5936 /ORGANISM="Euplotes crassus, Strain CT5" /LENGTH=37 /DNA_ID= /DNA_START= /DNA_END= /DNA_ORIENTATION=
MTTLKPKLKEKSKKLEISPKQQNILVDDEQKSKDKQK